MAEIKTKQHDADVYEFINSFVERLYLYLKKIET